MPVSYVMDFTALTDDFFRWNRADAVGTPVTVAYCFLEADELPSLTELPQWDPSYTNDYTAFDNLRQVATRSAFDEYSAASGVQFVEVENPELANIHFMSNFNTSDVSWAYFPSSYAGYSGTSEVVLTEYPNPWNGDWGLGGVMFNILLHEIGHAMGLDHPHEGILLDPSLDNANYTIMSYDSYWDGWDSNSYTPFRSTLAPLDVDALQYLYGSNTFSDLGWTTLWDETTDTFSLTGSDLDDILIGLRANSVLSGGDGTDKLYGQEGNDTLSGGNGADIMFAGSGNDKVYSGQGADNVFLGDGDDYVKVGGGLEEFHGGSGKDYISYYDSAGGVNVNLATNAVSGSWAANDTISGFESVSGSKTGGDTIYGTSGSNTIQTYGGNDKVYAGKGADKVNLGDGDDYVKVGGGLEEFHGGSGKDYISYYDSAGGVNVNLATNAVSGSWAANDTISGFESVSGSKTGGDTIYGTSGSNTIQTYGGNDKVYAGKGADKVNLGDGDDYVKVGGGLEEFHGGSGKDYISYYDSAGGVNVNLATNAVSGSWAANDTISGFESVSGSKTGGDTIYGTSGSNTIKTYGGNDEVYAGMGSDKVELGSGNDYVKVGGGIESFDGGSGTDYISYYDSAGGITIDLEADSVSGSWADNDTISDFEGASGSKTGADKMYGTSGSNTLKSYGGDDKLYGRGGDDKLYGGDGEDRFDGGAGTDLLYGGAGADVFHFDFGEDHDIIKDFENNIDTIQLDDFTFAEGQDAFDFATQVASDVVFDFGGGDMLTVENTTIGLLYNDLEII